MAGIAAPALSRGLLRRLSLTHADTGRAATLEHLVARDATDRHLFLFLRHFG